jgi:hypothetical protein
MSAPRRLASRLLRAVARQVPPDSPDSAKAMLRELDFVENDGGALCWALGSTTAIFRYSLPPALKTWFAKGSRNEEGRRRKDAARKAARIACGVAIAAGVALGAFGLLPLLFYFFPAWDLGPVPGWLAAIVVPELIFIVGFVALWRKKRHLAFGILLLAITRATHFLVHIATHRWPVSEALEPWLSRVPQTRGWRGVLAERRIPRARQFQPRVPRRLFGSTHPDGGGSGCRLPAGAHGWCIGGLPGERGTRLASGASGRSLGASLGDRSPGCRLATAAFRGGCRHQESTVVAAKARRRIRRSWQCLGRRRCKRWRGRNAPSAGAARVGA